jgi:hypothetical protein
MELVHNVGNAFNDIIRNFIEKSRKKKFAETLLMENPSADTRSAGRSNF